MWSIAQNRGYSISGLSFGSSIVSVGGSAMESQNRVARGFLDFMAYVMLMISEGIASSGTYMAPIPVMSMVVQVMFGVFMFVFSRIFVLFCVGLLGM